MPEAPKITRDDLEATFRQLQGEIDQRAEQAKSSAIPVGIGLAIVFLLIAYLLGKRVGRKTSTVVEIRRI